MLAIGCGRNIQHSSQEKAMSTAQAQLDSRQFEKAIETLESLRISNPHNEEIKIKLFHAYAGAGSFEALKVVGIWLEFETLLKEFRQNQEVNFTKQSENFAIKNLVPQLKKLLAPIPELTTRQKTRLAQAIELYQVLEFKLETAGRYSNFKWGTLHIYRLAINFKELVSEVDKFQLGDRSVDLKKIENVIIPKLKVTGQDILMAYKLFGFSFDKIKKITESLDKIVAKIVNDKDFKLIVNTNARNESEFFKSLIQDNIHVASTLIRKISAEYIKNRDNGNVPNTPETDLLLQKDVKAYEVRIETFIKIFIEKFTSKNPDIEVRLQSIFSESLKQEFLKATEECFKTKDTDPLKNLLFSKQPEVETLKSYYLLLVNEIQESELEDRIKDEIGDLNRKVELELLKEELEKIIDALKRDIRIIKLKTGTIIYKDRETLSERKMILEKEISWHDNYLRNMSPN